MNILESLVGGGGSNAIVSQIAQRFGLDENQARTAIASLVPALAGGVQRNATSPGGLESLLGALAGGGHQRYVDDPTTLAAPETVQDGNGILGHIFGTKEVSRQVAQQASTKTGIGADILKKMLPVVAALVMAQLAKRATQAPTQTSGPAAQAGGGADILGSLTGFLDTNRDGKTDVGDLLNMAKKMF